MNLKISIEELTSAIEGEARGSIARGLANRVVFDTRKINAGDESVFFALKGDFRDGHEFIFSAYNKGVRIFVVSESIPLEDFKGATFIRVENTLSALQRLANYHRSKFNYPVIAITGSFGKTIVKEWLYYFLKDKYRIARSPKSYNSQIGAALSLLEMHDDANIALIEAGISMPGEMEILQNMIRPTFGVFTGFGLAHRINFRNEEQHLDEKLKLFTNCTKVFLASSLKNIAEKKLNTVLISPDEKNEFPNYNSVEKENLSLVKAIVSEFGLNDDDFKAKLPALPGISLRSERFDGIQGNLIINDTYNLDKNALYQSLEFQMAIAEGRSRIVILGRGNEARDDFDAINEIVESFKPEKIIYWDQEQAEPSEFSNSVILIKGSRSMEMQKVAAKFRLRKHKTLVEINLSALRYNLNFFKSRLNSGTSILAMVKASAYGNGIEKIGKVLASSGVSYFGVAYADEGIEIREFDQKTPILVMNAEEDSFSDCIANNLEPAIYSFSQLDAFISELIVSGVSNYPIHIKVDTGMRRLGFETGDAAQIAEALNAQPEVYVKSIYTHLADADNALDLNFSEKQISLFDKFALEMEDLLAYKTIKHVLNSEGAARMDKGHYQMVRLGIGIYGISALKEIQDKLHPVISWSSTVSQVKIIDSGESVGYNRSFLATEKTQIAIIPVGYADGYKRNLSMGKGGVYIHGKFCPTVGKVCMDMIMVDVSGKNVQPGDKVEIIGENQSIQKLAKDAETIPYEILTGLSRRVHRIYVED